MRRRVPFLIALSIVSVACAGADDGFRYMVNEDLEAAVRLPSDWTVFSQDQVQPKSITPGFQIASPVRWFVAVDADPEPSASHVVRDFTADHPQGFFEVFQLDENDRAQMSILAVRNMVVPIDQLRDKFLQEPVVIVGYDDRIEADGMRGLDMIAQVQESEVKDNGELALIPGSYFQLNQKAWWDPKVERLYLGALMCSIDCYAENAAEIEATMDSWIASLP
jgi:hypothetical protein